MATVQANKTSHQGKYHMATTEFDQRVPHEVPSFTLEDVKNAIPPHLFKKPALKSLSYLGRDILLVVFMVLFACTINTIALNIANIIGKITASDLSVLQPYFDASQQRSWFVDSAYAFFAQPFIFKSLFTFSIPLIVYNIALTAGWIVYFWIQGVFLTGIWVLGHEAGHGAQFESKLANDVYGLFVHSFLLVPYFAWSISHRRHHSHCADMELDEVHVPAHINDLYPAAAHGYFHNDDNKTTMKSTSTFLGEVNKTLRDYSIFYRILNTAIFSFMGWWVYLFLNTSGRRYPTGTSPNHFLPSSPIFSKDERPLIIIGDIFLLAYCALFYKFTITYGLPTFICLYFIPYMVTNWWLVTITLLQHTHPALPHFSHDRWNYIQGALSTIDRDYGAFYNWALHNINDSHVTHHMFSYMPHYHAVEATPYIKKVVGKYYLRTEDEVPMFGVCRSLLKAWNDFHFISEDDHPALVLSHKVVDAMVKDGDISGHATNDVAYSKIIDENKEKAYQNSPYAPDGKRNVEKEVYWFRTLFFHQPDSHNTKKSQ